MGEGEAVHWHAKTDHVAEQGECVLSLIGKREGLEEGVPDEDGLVRRFVKHLTGGVEEVEVAIHVDELGGEEGVPVEAVLKEVAVDSGGVGRGVLVGAGEDEGFVGALGGAGLVGEELHGLGEMPLGA